MAKARNEEGGRSGVLPAAVVLIVIVLAAFLSIRALAPPKPVPADAPAEEFSAERAFGLLKEIAAEPHPLGTPAHDKVRDAILRMWRSIGFEPEIQKGLYHIGKGRLFAARVENILVRLPGTRPTPGRALMLATHYDSVQSAPGAADDGAGVVTLLETARALKAGPPPAEDVIFLITDGEEDGLIGASVFQAEHPWAKDIGLVLNFEARGTAGPSLMFQTSSGNRNLISALAATPHPRAFSMGAMVYRSMPNDSDLSVWLDAGIQGLNFAFISRAYDYHTAGDNLARLNPGSLQHHGTYALALARRFGSDGVPAPTRGDAVHVSMFGDVFVHYSRTMALFLLAVIAVLLTAAGVIGVKRGLLRAGGILLGIVFLLAALVVSAGLGFGFVTLVRASHGSWLAESPWRYSPGYLMAVVLLAASVTTFLFVLLGGRKSGGGTAFGAAVLWLFLASTLTIFAFDASYLGTGPALFLALGVLAWAGFGKRSENQSGPPLWSTALTSAGVVLFAAPVILLLFQSMFLTPLIAAVIGALVSLMLAAMTPSLEILRRGMGRGLPVLLLVLFAVLVAVSAATVRYSAEIPRSVSLQYRHDFDAGRAFWITPAESPDPWLEKAVGSGWKSGHPDPEQAGSAGAYSFREAPVSGLMPPDVQVVGDVVLPDAPPSSSSGNARILTLRIVSPRGGRRLTITIKAEGLQSAEIDGRPLVLIPENHSGFVSIFLNPGPGGFELKLASAVAPFSLTVRESNPELPDLPAFDPPPPPSGVRLDRRELLLSKTFVFPPPAEYRSGVSGRR